jgi:hypothetical protein
MGSYQQREHADGYKENRAEQGTTGWHSIRRTVCGALHSGLHPPLRPLRFPLRT